MTRGFSPTWNPVTSSRTTKLETRPDGAVIYAHTSRRVAGKFVTVKGPDDWAASDTLDEARKVSV